MAGEYERYKADRAAAYFKRVRSLSAKAAALRAEVDAQRAQADGLQGIDYAAMCGGGSPSPDAVPNAVIRLQGAVDAYCAELCALVDAQREAHDVIHGAERPEYAAALSRYYLAGESWEEVCVAMGYTWDGMMKLRLRALSDAYDRMPHAFRDPRHPAV